MDIDLWRFHAQDTNHGLDGNILRSCSPPRLLRPEPLKALQNLPHMHKIHFIHFDQVFEQHEDQVREQPCLSAKVGIPKLGKNFGENIIEVLAILEDLGCAEGFGFLGHLLHSFA